MPGETEEELSGVTRRFLEYVRYDTTSDESSPYTPSTRGQLEFLGILRDEMVRMGMENVELDGKGVVYASVPGGRDGGTVVGLLAHVDTSPDVSGHGVNPVVHREWDGEPIRLGAGTVIDPDFTKRMREYVGGTIITSDGTTLLGADDKAGVAIIMDVCEKLISDPSIPRPATRVAFTTDEEIGRGMEGFDTEKFGATVAYTVDGGPVGKVDTHTFNAWKAEFRVKGREVHPGSAKGVMVNASRVIAELVSLLKAGEMPENSAGREGYVYPVEIVSRTSEGKLKLLIRDFSMEGIRDRLEYLEEMVRMIELKFPGASVELVTREQYRNPGVVLEAHRELVEYAMKATGAVGSEPEETWVRGGTDGSRLSFMGVPTVNLPTGGELFHSKREWIAQEGMLRARDIVLGTLELWAGKDGGPA